MTSLFKLFVNTISSSTNVAAETLLRNIIKKFLEEPIQSDALSLELFTDWTIHLNLKKSFLNTELVNSYVPFMKFSSIYFANVKFDAAYNLSQFLIDMSRVVIDADMRKPSEIPKKDENLTESIHNFQEQLPIEKKNSFKDWIIDCVKKVDISLDHFTVIFNVSDEFDKLTFNIESLNMKFEKDIDIKLPNASLLIGEKRNQKSIAELNNITVSYKNNVASISIDLIAINISENIVKTLIEFSKLIPKALNENTNQEDGSNTKTDLYINIILNKLAVTVSQEITLELSQFKFQYRPDGLKFSFSSFSIIHNDLRVISIDSRAVKNEVPHGSFLFVNNSMDISLFDKFPRRISELIIFDEKQLNSNRVIINIPSILMNISYSFISSVHNIIEWVTSITRSIEQPTALEINKMSYIINININMIKCTLENLKIFICRPQVSLFSSQTAANLFIHSIFSIFNIEFWTQENYSMVNYLYKENNSRPSIMGIFNYQQQLGNDTEIGLDFKVNDFLLRIPSKFDFVKPFTKILAIFNSPKKNLQMNNIEDLQTENLSEKPNMKIIYNVNIEHIFIDYFALNMPGRIIALLPIFLSEGYIDTSPFQMKLNAKFNLELYLSNHRDDLPVSLFTNNIFQYAESNFAQIAVLQPTSVMLISNEDSSELIIDDIDLSLGCCFDSIHLLIALIMHIQYKLDNSPDDQTKTKHFDLPQTLMDMTTTLTQSLRLDNFQFDPNKNIPYNNIKHTAYKQFENLDTMVDTFYEKLEEDEEESVNLEYDDKISIMSSEPLTSEKVVISVSSLSINFTFYGGRDFDHAYNTNPIVSMPKIIFEKKNSVSDFDFDFITTRDEDNYLDAVIKGNLKVLLFEDDPNVSTRVIFEANKFDINDNIQGSAAKIILGKEEQDDRNVKGKIDILSTSNKRMELSFKLDLPNLFIFITQEQLNFFIKSADIKMPTFPSDLIVDEPLAFQLFELNPSDLQIAAHFRLWLDVHMDDIQLHMPKCQLFAVRGFDELIGGLVEFYVNELNKPGAAAIVGGLPVIKNLRRVGRAVRDLFTYDVQKYGVGVGFAKSFSALMQILALETLNMGANATSIAERFLYVAMKFLGGKDNAKEAINTGMATLVVQSKDRKKAFKAIPTMILAPGVLTMRKLTEMMKGLRDRINPNYTKTKQYTKK